jgi:Arc/MetJ-type ribon-helix-helix transcriptional regulator
MMRTGKRRARARAIHWQYDSAMPDMEGRVNFSIHLPDPLLADLDAYVQTQQTTRSGVIREAVREYLARHALRAWPTDLEGWMREPLPATAEHGPDFDAIRAEMNAAMRKPLTERPGADALLLDTNIVSAWARKSSSARCSSWRKLSLF